MEKTANRIEEIIKGQENIFDHDKEIEALAKHYAALLIGKQLEKQTPVEKKKHELPEYETVDLNSVKNHKIRSIGAEHAALSVIKRYLDLSRISHNRLHRTSDLLIRHKEEIEERLNHSERDLFSLKEKIILTNTYFESSKKSQLKQRDRSKDKQKGQPTAGDIGPRDR